MPGVAPQAVEAAVQRPRILIVDDEPTLLAAYRRLLTDRMDLVTAGGGREALEQLEKNPAFDAIVCDLVMPDLDGQGLYHEVVARFPGLAARMVFCTAGAFTPRDVAFAATMRGRLLAKPFEPETLEALVRRFTAGW
jgi:CheY-like chemotaxis protein